MAKKQEEKSTSTGVNKILEELNKKYGSGTIITGKEVNGDIPVIDSGSLMLNLALKVGGIPLNKLIEIFGMESCGKSTLVLHIIANFQKAGKRCALINLESSFSKTYATNLGVDVDNLYIVQPETLEDAYNICVALIESGEFQLLCVDSHTSGRSAKSLEGEIGDSTIAQIARINSQALNKIHPLLEKHSCIMLAVSQLRVAIGAYGDPNQPTGGMGYKFYSDVRLKVSKSVDKATENNKTTVEVVKSKVGAPFGKAEFLIKWNEGIDRLQEIIDLAVEQKFLKLGGAGWYTLESGVKIQGDIALKEFLNDNPEFKQELEEKVLASLKPQEIIETTENQ